MTLNVEHATERDAREDLAADATIEHIERCAACARGRDCAVGDQLIAIVDGLLEERPRWRAPMPS